MLKIGPEVAIVTTSLVGLSLQELLCAPKLQTLFTVPFLSW